MSCTILDWSEYDSYRYSDAEHRVLSYSKNGRSHEWIANRLGISTESSRQIVTHWLAKKRASSNLREIRQTPI